MSTIHNFITSVLELSFDTGNLEIDENSKELLDDFIHNPQTLLLQAIINDKNKLAFLINLQCNVKRSIIFYKTVPQVLVNKSSINNVNMITLSTNAALSLYQMLKQIYSPLLAMGNDLYSNKLQKNLSDLESNLRVIAHEKEDVHHNFVLSVDDEASYWRTMAERRDARKADREAASAFSVLFEDIIEEIKIMRSSSLQELRDSIENIAGILDDVWRYTAGLTYAQDRMMHVFDIVGHVICSMIQKAVLELNMWVVHHGAEDNRILAELSHALNDIQTWISACKSLTETYWPNYALHTWKGNYFVPLFCVNFEGRLTEIYDIRSTFNQLNKLMTTAEKYEFGIDNILSIFQNVNVWIINGANHQWESAILKFSANLRQAEINVAEKLKPRMRNTSTDQTLYEFQRYKTLINRPVIKSALASELEWFVSGLLVTVQALRAELDGPDVHACTPPDVSPVVRRVQWAKRAEHKIKEIKTCTENYLREFEKSSELLTLTSAVLKDLQSMYTQALEEWSRELQVQVKSGSLSLSLEKPVVQFSSASRLLEVNFNPRLEAWQAEARALSGLVAVPPTAARSLAALAAALPHARALQQVASFHNTLGERMVPSTRPMMLQAALDLSALVQDQKPVYWNDEEQLTNYTNKLKDMVLKLETQNTYLTGQHIAIRNIVEELMDTELLSQQTLWKKRIKDIRDIIDKVEITGYKNTEMWRSHWDMQIYKAMECQYIKALLSLHTHFPPMKVDLVLRGGSVCVQPRGEEVRASLYAQLRRLVSLPAHLPPLAAANTELYTTIVHKHSWVGNKAVAALETALSALERVRTRWARRSAACAPDLSALCAAHLTRAEHWEQNFKACKAFGQAVAKMSFEDEKVYWITVSPWSLRRELEGAARRLWGALVGSLRESCRGDAAALAAFAAAATPLLADHRAPATARDLVDLSAERQALRDKIPEMEELVAEVKKKSHMLRTWGGDSTIDDTIKEWQRLREQIDSQQELFEHQTEAVKEGLRGEWDNLQTRAEAWSARWSVRVADVRADTFGELCARASDLRAAAQLLDELQAERDELMNECKKFNLDVDVSSTWKDAEDVKNEYTKTWSVLVNYSEEFETLAATEWVVFGRRLHRLDELVCHWAARLEPFTPVTLHLKQELDRYTDLTPALKYLRGGDFTEKHWREIFNVLEMEPKKPDTLLLKDFLNVAENIRKHMKDIQKISAAASSEAAVRSTLNEIELWYAGARFTVVHHAGSDKRPVPIVKDYKDILTKVSEQQWAASAGGAAARAWLERLQAVGTLARAAHAAQRRWLYLEPILATDDGELGVKFRRVDQAFKQVARILDADPRLSVLMQSTKLQPMLDSISEQLNSCQAALNQYMDEKRSIFPRLYFLSDDDLLELLGQARAGSDGREAVMQSHLKKLFPGITGVRLGPAGLSITALCSHYGEVFQLDHPVDVDCSVEVWLKNFENEIRSSLKSLSLKCLKSNSALERDPFSLPTQVICLAQNIRFTEQAEKAITSKELHELKNSLEKQNLYFAVTEVEDEAEKYKRQALILQCDFHIIAVQSLIEGNVVSTSDWLWQKHLRFYLQDDEVLAKMALATVPYSYEYLGVQTGQFVRTHVTDECFLILTQSLHLGLVGNPFGPAGTGKTESVKALGALFGRLVLVFNCDEAMDARCVGRVLRGLALCGAWGCLDEFNRLGSAALAAAAHQLSALLAAPHATGPTLLDGSAVAVSPWCGVMVTMNPSGVGYGGRRALPSALSALLRPLALRPPAARELAARLLAAQRVPADDARALAAALHDVFTFASSLLSGARHYDWGLRALKSVVSGCGAALERRTCGSLASRLAVLRSVLRVSTLSKLTPYDAQRFENILSMVFADIPEEEPVADPLRAALEAAVKHLNLTHDEFQIQKCKELYEQMQQRMGVAIVGPPGSGKTTIRKILKTALTLSERAVSERVVHVKAMSRGWLLGRAERDTRAWTDGVVAALAHHAAAQPAHVSSWMVFDGDVEPGWAEALNSLLDDNRLLALAGARVQLPAHAHAVFETHRLSAASPATVSRLAILLLSDENNCAPLVLDSWIKNAEFEDEIIKTALPLLHTSITKCIQWLHTNKSELTYKPDDIPVVHQIIAQFEYLAENTKSSGYASAEDLVYAALERGVAGLVTPTAMDKLYEQVIGSVRMQSMFDVEEMSESDGSRLFVSARIRGAGAGLHALLRAGRHAALVGSDAVGKSLLLEHILKDHNGTVITIECTPLLEPADILMELKRNNVLRSGNASDMSSVGGGEPVTLLVRGLHRARTDRWGSRPVHAFLLQVCCGGGAWEVSSADGAQWLSVRARLLATTRSDADLAPRLRAALALVMLSEPDEDELLEVSKIRLRENISKNIIPDEEVSHLAKNIVLLYKEVSEAFTTQPHYKWDTSHIETMCENIKWYSPANVSEVHMAVNAEANMIFRDRLVSDEERSQYRALASKYVPHEGDVCFTPRLRDGVYLEPVGYEQWCRTANKLINQCLTDNENTFGETGVEVCRELAVLFPAVATAMRGGVMVCVGSAGADASAATQLVCAALGAAYHDVPATPTAHGTQLANTFKSALAAASEGMRACVVVNAEGSERMDADDEDEEGEERSGADACLSRVEALMRAHTVSGLPAALARAAPTSQQGATLQDVKQNLGIVICIDKDSEDLWQLITRYPWLCGALQWAGRWADDTLRRLPALIIHRLMKEHAQEVTKDDIDAIPVEGFVSIYRSVRAAMLAPCRYVALVRAYYHIVTRKRDALLHRKNMLTAGVEALRRARVEVATLQEEAATQEAALSDEQRKANEALEQISATVRANTDKKEEMSELKRSIEIENEQLQTRKKEIEEELAAVEPVIAAARAAVGDIRPEALSEVRSLRAPPDAVRDVLEGVLRLMGVGDTSWHSMKNFLSKRGVKEDIRHLDAGNVSPDAAAAVARLVERRPGSFEEATARRASAACAPLAAWVRAQLKHARALTHVRPLRDAQHQLQRKVRELEAQLAALEGGLATVDERVAALSQQLGGHTRAAAALELRVAAVVGAIRRASDLLEQLAQEYTDWEAHLEETTKELTELNLLSVLAAAYIVYLPELTEPQAREVLANWATQMGHEDLNFSPINFLSTPDRQFKWVADGLPSDQSAMKNAVVIEQYLGDQKCGFSPLIIDPDGEAEAWLRNTLAGTAADFIPQHSDKLKTAIQYATRHGRVLVITEVEQCGWWCDATRASGVRTLLLARTPPRHAPPPRCAAQRSVLYVAPRLHALVDQLVHYTIQKQNPDMIERYKEIKLEKAALQKQQHELQENLLKELSNNRDILHDEALSESLQKTREAGARIAEALSAADALEGAVTRASAASAPTAARAAALALAVRQLQPRHATLALPLDAVQRVFLDAVRRQDGNNVNSEDVVRYFMRTMFDRLLLSLHKRDKYIVLMHLLKQIYDDRIPEKLWKIFINHISVVEDASIVDEIKQQYGWIADEHLKKLAQIKMQDSELFNRLYLDNADMWLAFQSSGDLNSIRHLNLSAFENVVAVSALRPQSTYRAVVAFVDRTLGAVRGGACLERAERYAERTRPALLLGAHASLQLAAHAHAQSRPLLTVGIEEGMTAWEAALKTSQNGGWLSIVVGASPFTRDLQTFITLLSQRSVEELSEDFRLWIITEDRDVPPMIANLCLSVVLEAPEGVKHNVCGTLSAWASVRAPPTLLRHFACLALFHAVVQERRAYIPQGWSRWYSWEWGEVSAARRAVEALGAGRGAREICGALYEARADEARDRRVLRALRRALLDAASQRDWSPPTMEVVLPLAPNLTTYLEAFNTLPEIDPPELLGLPANYRIAWEKNAADMMIAGLRDYDTTAISKKTDNTTPTHIVLGLWKKLMSGSPLIKGDFDIETACGGRGWWHGVCAGEARDAMFAARALHRTLTQLARAPHRASHSLHKVPDEWQLLWSGPDRPEEYIKEFCFRARAAVTRLQECKRNAGVMPKEVDVRTFLRPPRLLSALRASAAERTRRAPHALALAVVWGDGHAAEAETAVVGLRLSGGEWAGRELQPARADAAPDVPAPPLRLRYVPADADDETDAEEGEGAGREGFYAVVYESAARAAPLWRARAPLAPHWSADRAELHALALYVAPV